MCINYECLIFVKFTPIILENNNGCKFQIQYTGIHKINIFCGVYSPTLLKFLSNFKNKCKSKFT